MGKSKKRKNADFQKVKLKVGKRLKKADNVTNASFHTRSIQITQQLKTHVDEPSTKRKLNLNDLLTQCQHYNISVRHDAVSGLRELLQTHPELIRSNLANVLEKVSQLYMDKDAVVRAAVVKLLKSVLPSVSVSQIQPFFPIVSAHLCCAMTHIYDEIQADSLQLLDLYLETFPSLVIEKSNQILPNFIEQISRQKVGSKNRSLSVNPNNKMASQKWRTNVLSRLHRLLDAILGQTEGKKVTTESCERESLYMIKFDADKPTYCQPFSSAAVRSWSSPGFFIRSNSSNIATKAENRTMSLSDEMGIQKFVKTIVPLLIECWVEASGGRSTNADDSLLSTDSYLLKSSVLAVIQLLWECVSTKNPKQVAWLKLKYQADFQNFFLQYFPYSILDSANRKTKRDKADTSETDARSLNLAVCDLMTHFLPCAATAEQHSMLPWEVQISEFLLTVLQDDSVDIKNIHVIIKILTRMIDSHMDSEYLTKLMMGAFNRYTSAHPLSAEKRVLMMFLSELVIKGQSSSSRISSYIKDKFLLSLPELFTHVVRSNQQMSAQIIITLKTATCQTCPIAYQSVQNFVTNILVSHKDVLLELDSSVQRSFMELLFHVDCLDKSVIHHLAALIGGCCLPTSISTYAIQIMQQRYNRKQTRVQETANYLSFLVTVLLGDKVSFTEEKRSKFCEKSIKMSGDEEVWTKTVAVTQVIGDQLLSFPNIPQVVDIITCVLTQHMMNTEDFKVETVAAMIFLIGQMSLWNYPINIDFTTQMVELIWSSAVSLPDDWSGPHHQDNILVASLTRETITYLLKTTNALDILLTKISNSLQATNMESDVLEVCRPATHLLQHNEIRTVLQTLDCAKLLKKAINESETRFQNIIKQQWWSDLTFMMSNM